MNLQRAAGLAAVAQGSMRNLFQAQSVDTMGVCAAGAAACVGWMFGSANTSLLWVVGLAMLLDLVVGSVKAVVNPLEEFSIQLLYGGFIGKIFRSLLIPTASLVDWLYIASPMPLPAGYTEAFPVTALVMVGLAAAEISSVLNHFREGGVAPELIALIMRQIDRMKLGAEPPTRRSYDKEAIVLEQERRMRAESPPPTEPS